MKIDRHFLIFGVAIIACTMILTLYLINNRTRHNIQQIQSISKQLETLITTSTPSPIFNTTTTTTTTITPTPTLVNSIEPYHVRRERIIESIRLKPALTTNEILALPSSYNIKEKNS